MKLVLRPAARAELREAVGWYEEKRPGLGTAFLDEIERSLQLLQENPRLHATIHLDIRRASVQRFPYGIYYFLLDEQIQILAIVHDARHPSIWQSRR